MTDITQPTPIADMLITLNALREANGKKPLSSWKASRADLELRIQQEQPAPAAPVVASPDAQVLAKVVNNAGAGKAFLGALKDVLNGAAEPDHIVDVMKDHGVEPKVTKVPASAPELTTPAKRKAVIDAQAKKAVDTDTPTTVIDVKLTAKAVRKATKPDALKAGIAKAFATAKPEKDTKKPLKAKPASTTPRPQGKGDFALYLESIEMEGRVARAKLRRAKIKPVDGRYELTDAVKAALNADGRKKDK